MSDSDLIKAKAKAAEVSAEKAEKKPGLKERIGINFGPTTRGFLIASAVFLIVLYAQNFERRGDYIAACGRGNVARVSELRQRQNLIENAQERADDPQTSTEGSAALARARARKEELIDSQASVAIKPGSVVADCNESYPKPWPFG